MEFRIFVYCEFCCRASPDDAVQRDADTESSDDNDTGTEEGTDIRRSRRQQRNGDCGRSAARLRHVPEREEILASVHVSEEEQKEEDDGVLQLLYVCQVSPRAVELYRFTGDEYTRKSHVNSIFKVSSLTATILNYDSSAL